MHCIPRRRPSAAMIVAVLALALALGGSAIAGTGILSKAKVKAVANKQITKRAPGLTVASAKAADTAKSADVAGRATNVHAANVDSDGKLLGSIPAGVTSERVRAGVYTVTFNRRVAGCLISAALGGNDLAARPGSVDVVPAPIVDETTLVVATFDAAAAEADRDFYVQMICP
jgi:hypothetical protein